MNGVPFFATAAFCLAMAFCILWVNPGRLINRVVGLTSLFVSGSFYSIWAAIAEGVHNPNPYSSELLFWMRANGATYAFVPWTLWMMKEAIIAEHSSLLILVRRSWCLLLACSVLATICFTDSYIPADSNPADRLRGMGYIFFTSGIYALIGFIMFGAYRAMHRISGVRRIEMQFFMLNACVAGMLIVAIAVIRRIHNVPGLKYVPVIMIICCLCTMVWAVSYHRIFDARQSMLSLGQRIAMLALLALGTLGFTDLLSRGVGLHAGVAGGAALAGGLVFYCNGVTRKWLKLDPGQLLAGPRGEIIAYTRRESNPAALRSEFEGLLKKWCHTDVVKFISPQESGSPDKPQATPAFGLPGLHEQGWLTPEYLQRRRPGKDGDQSLAVLAQHGFSAVISAPSGSDTPSLIIGLGPKHSLRPYTYPDITLLLNLAELMDNVLTHARLAQHAAKIAQMESAAMISRSLAHDLNNLTMPVATYLLHSQGRAAPGSAEEEVYDAALHSVKVMHDYIRESLFFSKRLVPECREVNPRAALDSVLRLAQERAARRDITLRSHCEPVEQFHADPVLLQRLALNLINNAIDASPHLGTVTVSVGQRNLEHVYLRVEDQGVGIPAGNLRRIFDPYFTTKDTGDAGRGLGLGLAICRKITDLHGGDIEVTSTLGQGSAFTAIFPRFRPMQPAAERRTVNVPQASLVGSLRAYVGSS